MLIFLVLYICKYYVLHVVRKYTLWYTILRTISCSLFYNRNYIQLENKRAKLQFTEWPAVKAKWEQFRFTYSLQTIKKNRLEICVMFCYRFQKRQHLNSKTVNGEQRKIDIIKWDLVRTCNQYCSLLSAAYIAFNISCLKGLIFLNLNQFEYPWKQY